MQVSEHRGNAHPKYCSNDEMALFLPVLPAQLTRTLLVYYRIALGKTEV